MHQFSGKVSKGSFPLSELVFKTTENKILVQFHPNFTNELREQRHNRVRVSEFHASIAAVCT